MMRFLVPWAVGSLFLLVFTGSDSAAAETFDDILDFYDASIGDDALVGTGKNATTQENRENALRNKLIGGNNLVIGGYLIDGCAQLFEAETRTDGVPKPDDFVEGANAPALANLIDGYRTTLGCIQGTVGPDGGTIEGFLGTSVTVPPGALTYEAEINIEPALDTQITGDTGGLPVVGQVEFTFNVPGDVAKPNAPFQFVIPAPPDLPLDAQVTVGQQRSVFVLDESVPPKPIKKSVFHAVAMGTVVATGLGNEILTDSGSFPGIFSAGIYTFIALPEPVFTGLTNNSHTDVNVDGGVFPATAEGHITDAAGNGVAGATVVSTIAPWISLTDTTGGYTIPVIATHEHFFTLQAFAPLTGQNGLETFQFGVLSSSDINPLFSPADIELVESPTINATYKGIRNGGFERGDLSSWTFDDGEGGSTASAFVLQLFGPTAAGTTCTPDVPGDVFVTNPTVCFDALGNVIHMPYGGNTTITPFEGEWMAVIATGPGSSTASTRLIQNFKVPKGVTTLRFNYNFVSEEFPEFVDTIFNDTFTATVTNLADSVQTAQITAVTVNNVGTDVTPIGDCGFIGGDISCGMTGWRTAQLSLPSWASNTEVEVALRFHAIDSGDEIYDTWVFLDNIRFSTVWLDVKRLPNATADASLIKQNIKDANEILSQAGVNLRLCGVGTDPRCTDSGIRDISSPSDSPIIDNTFRLSVPAVNTFRCLGNDISDRLTVINNETQAGMSSLTNLENFVGNIGAPLPHQAQPISTATGNVNVVNVYYAVELLGIPDIGHSVNEDDYCSRVLNEQNAGIFLDNNAAQHGKWLAHELGHYLMRPYASDKGNLEHTAMGSFMDKQLDSFPPGSIEVNSDQSIAINNPPPTVNGFDATPALDE